MVSCCNRVMLPHSEETHSRGPWATMFRYLAGSATNASPLAIDHILAAESCPSHV